MCSLQSAPASRGSGGAPAAIRCSPRGPCVPCEGSELADVIGCPSNARRAAGGVLGRGGRRRSPARAAPLAATTRRVSPRCRSRSRPVPLSDHPMPGVVTAPDRTPRSRPVAGLPPPKHPPLDARQIQGRRRVYVRMSAAACTLVHSRPWAPRSHWLTAGGTPFEGAPLRAPRIRVTARRGHHWGSSPARCGGFPSWWRQIPGRSCGCGLRPTGVRWCAGDLGR